VTHLSSRKLHSLSDEADGPPVSSVWWRPHPRAARWLPCEVGSIAEGRLLHLLAGHNRKRLREHHAHHLSRIYPAGSRTLSSNIEPGTYLAALQAGFQMTCLNFQTWDTAMQLNRALFRLNGGCGYLHRDEFAAGDPSPRATLSGGIQGGGFELSLRIISAHHVSKPGEERYSADLWDNFDPQRLLPTAWKSPTVSPATNLYCQVECWQGHGGLSEEPSVSTSAVKPHDGLHPTFEHDVVLHISQPRACVLRLSVLSRVTLGKDELLGSDTIPLVALRTGYRSLRLRSAKGLRLQLSSLLIHSRLSELGELDAPPQLTQEL